MVAILAQLGLLPFQVDVAAGLQASRMSSDTMLVDCMVARAAIVLDDDGVVSKVKSRSLGASFKDDIHDSASPSWRRCVESFVFFLFLSITDNDKDAKTENAAESPSITSCKQPEARRPTRCATRPPLAYQFCIFCDRGWHALWPSVISKDRLWNK